MTPTNHPIPQEQWASDIRMASRIRELEGNRDGYFEGVDLQHRLASALSERLCDAP